MTAQDVALELQLSGAYTEVPLYSAAGATITKGHDPYGGSWPRPTKIECEINNDSLNYDPTRPESALYGIAGRNTKGRVTVNGDLRAYAEASAWQPERTPEHSTGLRGRSWTRLTAEGLLRRLGRWTDPLRSPMYRTISGRSTSIGHWSLEDDRDALSLANSYSGGAAGTYKGGATLAESESPLGATQTVQVVTGSQLAGTFVSASATDGWQVSWSFKLPSIPGSATYGTLLQWSTSNGYTWIAEVNNTTYQFRVTIGDGAGGTTTLLSSPVVFGTGYEPDQWITMRVKSSVSAGTVTVEPAWYAQGDTNEVGITSTFSGSVGKLQQWWQSGDAVNTGSWFSHVFGVTTTVDSLVGAAAQQVFNGYLGETAYDRFGRLCTELGITWYIRTGSVSADTQAMGAQSSATLLELLTEIRETDDCRIDDAPLADTGLIINTRRNLYNQDPALTLTYGVNVAIPFVKVLDDQATHNVVTVKNAAGGEVTATLASGAMSTQAPPSGVGEYKTTVNVNVADESTQLTDIATWHRAKGTLERPRYEEITVDLLANPGLETNAHAVREGNMIKVNSAEPEAVYLLVTGIIEKVGAATHTITYQTEMYDPYLIGIWDDASFRYDARTTTLASAATSTATSLALTTTDAGDVWSTTGVPYALLVGGERVTCTAMSAAAGSGPYTQTATVTRSVNGVVKAQTAGTSVHLADVRRWGL